MSLDALDSDGKVGYIARYMSLRCTEIKHEMECTETSEPLHTVVPPTPVSKFRSAPKIWTYADVHENLR